MSLFFSSCFSLSLKKIQIKLILTFDNFLIFLFFSLIFMMAKLLVKVCLMSKRVVM